MDFVADGDVDVERISHLRPVVASVGNLTGSERATQGGLAHTYIVLMAQQLSEGLRAVRGFE